MTPVLIAGAGPTGLVLALWLTRRGISVRIVDKAAEPGTTSRAGEGLTPYPFILVHPQDKHERLLIRELEALGVTVERPVELTRVEQHEHGVRATLRGADGIDEVCEAGWLAGCGPLRQCVGATTSRR